MFGAKPTDDYSVAHIDVSLEAFDVTYNQEVRTFWCVECYAPSTRAGAIERNGKKNGVRNHLGKFLPSCDLLSNFRSSFENCLEPDGAKVPNFSEGTGSSMYRLVDPPGIARSGNSRSQVWHLVHVLVIVRVKCDAEVLHGVWATGWAR